MPAFLLAFGLAVSQAPQRADTLRVWEAVLRASYDSAAAGDSYGHPPRGLVPWLAPTATRSADDSRAPVALDSTWLATLIANRLVRGVCEADCLLTNDRLRVVLSLPTFRTDSDATVDVVYHSVTTSPTTPACGLVDFDELRFDLRRGAAGWTVTGRTFQGGGSGITFGSDWDAHCGRPAARSLPPIAGVWELRLGGRAPGLSEVQGQVIFADSAVHQQYAEGRYHMKPALQVQGRASSCSDHGRARAWPRRGSDSLHIALEPDLGGFDCTVDLMVVYHASSLTGVWESATVSNGLAALRRHEHR